MDKVRFARAMMLGGLLGAGCALDEMTDEATTEAAMVCSPFLCGDNAATAGDELIFDEVDVLFHRPNYAGVSILDARRYPMVAGSPDLTAASLPLQITIDQDNLVGIDSTGWRHVGGALVGTVIRMKYERGGQVEIFELLVEQFAQAAVRFVAGPDEVVPSYLIKSRRPEREPYSKFERFVCNHAALTTDPLWAAAPHHALVYRGDRYDPYAKRVLPTNNPADGWSFLACAGSAAGKLHLHRHTHAGAYDDATQTPVYPTTIAQRTLLLEVITADYCYTGAPQFTVDGTPLLFTAAAAFAMPAIDVRTGLKPPAGVRSIEAIWSHAGLVCMDEPRRQRFLGTPPPPGLPQIAYTRAGVEAACGMPAGSLPACGALAPLWAWIGNAITVNPW